MKLLNSLIFLISIICNSQTTNIEYTYDFLDEETTPVYNFWKQYVAYKADNNDLYKTMWKKEDSDLIISASGFNPNFYEMYTNNKLLYIKKLSDNKFEVASMFYWIQDENNVNLISIVKYIIRKSESEYVFENYLHESTKNWKKQNVGLIDYYFPDNYDFNLENANNANNTINKLNKLFDLNETKIHYYIAENCDKQLEFLGLNYIATTGLMDQCGYFDKSNDILLSTFFAGENYAHEIIHLINKKFPNAHYLLLTGLSVYHDSKNASLGRSSYEIFRDFNEYAKSNKEYVFSFTGTFPKINNKIGVEYIISSILIDEILNEGGIDLLIDSLQKLKTQKDLEVFIKEKLKIENQDETIRKTANKMFNPNYKFKIEL